MIGRLHRALLDFGELDAVVEAIFAQRSCQSVARLQQLLERGIDIHVAHHGHLRVVLRHGKQRLHHPTKAEWDTLRTTKPPPVVGSAPINSSYYTGWRNFGLADPCDLLEAALDAVPGDGAWRFALERYAQRVERTDYADQAINLAQRTDTNARNEVDELLDARPTCT